MQRFDRNGDTMENNVKKNEIISELRQLYRSLYGDNVQAWLDLENILEQAESGRPGGAERRGPSSLEGGREVAAAFVAAPPRFTASYSRKASKLGVSPLSFRMRW
mgnify:CR=1 FL=1